MQNILQNLSVKLWLKSYLNTKEWFNPQSFETDLFLFYNLKKLSDDEMRYLEIYSETNQTSAMELFEKIVNNF